MFSAGALVNRLLFQQGSLQSRIANTGYVIGLSLLLLSLQLHYQIGGIIDSENKQPDHILISKPVSTLSTLSFGRSHFSAEEIQNIAKQPFTAAVGAFESNHFRISATDDANKKIGFSTELFFEAIADSFIDVRPANFQWKIGQKRIPIIIAEDFLHLYNFGYALTRGLPQLSQQIVRQVIIRLELTGPAGSYIFEGQIVGFSNRIPSILVPDTFLRWANRAIGQHTHTANAPARLLIRTVHPADSRAFEYFDAHGYQYDKEKNIALKAATIAQGVSFGIAIVGILFVLFGLMLFLLLLRLVLADHQSEIRLLFQLGYTRQLLTQLLLKRFFIQLLIATCIAAAIFLYIQQQFSSFIANQGLPVSEYISSWVLPTGVLIISSCFFAEWYTVTAKLKQYQC
jgi:hypothetical protein